MSENFPVDTSSQLITAAPNRERILINGAGATIYYSTTNRQVSAVSNDGSLAVGQQRLITVPTWIASGGQSRVTVAEDESNVVRQFDLGASDTSLITLPVVRLSTYSSLDQAYAVVKATGKPLLIDQDLTLASTWTIAESVNIQLKRGITVTKGAALAAAGIVVDYGAADVVIEGHATIDGNKAGGSTGRCIEWRGARGRLLNVTLKNAGAESGLVLKGAMNAGFLADRPAGSTGDTYWAQGRYRGTWAAATNSPFFVNGTQAGTAGDIYRVTSSGSVNFGAGAITFAIGDYVYFDGAAWQKLASTFDTLTDDNVANARWLKGASTWSVTDSPSLACANVTSQSNGNSSAHYGFRATNGGLLVMDSRCVATLNAGDGIRLEASAADGCQINGLTYRNGFWGITIFSHRGSIDWLRSENNSAVASLEVGGLQANAADLWTLGLFESRVEGLAGNNSGSPAVYLQGCHKWSGRITARKCSSYGLAFVQTAGADAVPNRPCYYNDLYLDADGVTDPSLAISGNSQYNVVRARIANGTFGMTLAEGNGGASNNHIIIESIENMSYGIVKSGGGGTSPGPVQNNHIEILHAQNIQTTNVGLQPALVWWQNQAGVTVSGNSVTLAIHKTISPDVLGQTVNAPNAIYQDDSGQVNRFASGIGLQFGTLANRPPMLLSQGFYYETTTPALTFWNGSVWKTVTLT